MRIGSMLFILLLCASACRAQTAGVSFDGEAGITETVEQIMTRERTSSASRTSGSRQIKPRLVARRAVQNPTGSELGQRTAIHGSGPFIPQTLGVNFEGENSTEAPFTPPDTMGAVGPTQFLVCVNGRIKLFSKTGVLDSNLNTDTDTFFASVRNGSSCSDPHVRYDKLSGRWFISIINVSTPNRILIAVSSGPTITNASSFTFFQFQHDFGLIAGATDFNNFADYDTPGIDANAMYLGVNIFAGNNFVGSSGFVIRKAELLSGGTIHVTAFRELCTASTSGAYTPQGVDNDDPNATEGYFAGIDAIDPTKIDIVRISNPAANAPTMTTLSVTVPTMTSSLGAVPAKGSLIPLDDNGDARLFEATIKNGTLYTAHTIRVNNTGAFNAAGDRDGSRWYQIGNLTSTPTLLQSGTVFDNAGSNPRSFFFPTIVASGQGHAVLGCSMASNVDFASCAVAGRLSTDPLNTLQAPVIEKAGTAAYNLESAVTTQRWGDYSYTSVDPIDDMTIWTIQECCQVTSQYSCYVMQMKAPPPATPISTAPVSLATTVSNVTVVITGQSTAGSGFFDPGPNLASPAVPYNHISAAVNGANITVNSVKFTDATHITLNITTTGATAGTYSVTVTNPDGQQVTSAANVISIVAAPPLVLTGPTATPGSTTANVPVQFASSASGGVPPISFSWTFGDSGNSSIANPSHAYAAAGNFTANVTATDSVGQSVSGTTTVKVTIPLIFTSAPSATPTTAFTGQPIAFSSAASGNGALTFAWNFGDGSNASTANTTHAYSLPGVYTAMLTVTDTANGPISGAIDITVNPPYIGTGPDTDGDGIADSVDQLLGVNPADPTTFPLSDPTAPPTALTITKMQVKLNFSKGGSDSISISGTLPVTANVKLNGQHYVAQVGDFFGVLTLNGKGQAKSATAQFKVMVKARKGVIAAQTAKFGLKLGHATFAQNLAAAGLANATIQKKVNVPVSFIFNKTLFFKSQPLSYTAKQGKSGSAK